MTQTTALPMGLHADALIGGFAQGPQQSARAFRAALEAMARPGTIWTVEGAVPPAPLSVAAGVLLLVVGGAIALM